MSKAKRPKAYSAVQASVGQRIRWSRELVIPNQAECARLIGVDASTLNKIEAGDRAPSIFNILELSNRLRVSTDFLLKGRLTAHTDQELALRLAALHPELVLQLASRVQDRDMDRDDDRPQGTTRPGLDA